MIQPRAGGVASATDRLWENQRQESQKRLIVNRDISECAYRQRDRKVGLNRQNTGHALDRRGYDEELEGPLCGVSVKRWIISNFCENAFASSRSNGNNRIEIVSSLKRNNDRVTKMKTGAAPYGNATVLVMMAVIHATKSTLRCKLASPCAFS